MLFLKTVDGDYWQWCQETMKAINYCGGGFTIDENSGWFMSCKVYETDSWHTLYCETGYIPIEMGDVRSFTAWLDPQGRFWYATAHACNAVDIVDIYYGLQLKTFGMNCAEDYLIEHGWLKLTKGAMWPIYVDDNEKGNTWKISQATFNSLFDYCHCNDLKMPKNIEVI